MRPRPFLALFALCLCTAACNGHTPPSPATSAHATQPATRPTRPTDAEAPSRPPETRRYRVSWSRITKTSGCFFFSAPLRGGRDANLGGRGTLKTQDSDRASLTFGKTSFGGEQRGKGLRLRRKSLHRFQGAWRVEERITLEEENSGLPRAFGGGGWVGVYSYEECEIGKPKSCPGRCRISARLKLSPLR